MGADDFDAGRRPGHRRGPAGRADAGRGADGQAQIVGLRPGHRRRPLGRGAGRRPAAEPSARPTASWARRARITPWPPRTLGGPGSSTRWTAPTTSPFGLSAWCSALALRDDDGLVLGAVYEPVTDLLWLGGRDRPTTCNKARRSTPLVNQPLSHCSLTTYLHPTSHPATPTCASRCCGSCRRRRRCGCSDRGSVELASIAGGRLGAYVQNDCLDWDWLPRRRTGRGRRRRHRTGPLPGPSLAPGGQPAGRGRHEGRPHRELNPARRAL